MKRFGVLLASAALGAAVAASWSRAGIRRRPWRWFRRRPRGRGFTAVVSAAAVLAAESTAMGGFNRGFGFNRSFAGVNHGMFEGRSVAMGGFDRGSGFNRGSAFNHGFNSRFARSDHFNHFHHFRNRNRFAFFPGFVGGGWTGATPTTTRRTGMGAGAGMAGNGLTPAMIMAATIMATEQTLN